MIRTVAALGSFSWAIISLMVLIDPSSTMAAEIAPRSGILFLLLSTALVLFLIGLNGRGTTRGRFYLFFPLTFLLLLLLGWISALLVHRDFFTWPAQLIMIYFTMFLAKIDALGLVKRKVQVYRALYLVAMVVFILWIGWVMLMSWAIVVRSEPRWIESTFYNFCNGLIGLVMIYTAGLLRDRAKQTIRITTRGILLEERNVSELLSPQEHNLIRVFLQAPEQSRNCKTLLDALRGNGNGNGNGNGKGSGNGKGKGKGSDNGSPGGGVAPLSDEEEIVPQTDCPTCHREGWTASKCGAYRNLKNRIGDAKKYLELLQIGTIVPVSENPRDIKELGWRLRLFDDVRLEGKGR
jgi:hypothetical protein